MASKTHARQLAEHMLGRDLSEWAAERRPTTSWDDLAAELLIATGLKVHGETLRLWLAAEVAEVAS